MTREETSKYTDLLPDGKAVQFSFEMEAKSVITSPSGEMQLDGPGFYEITGLAWSGRGTIRASTSRPTAAAPGARRALQEPGAADLPHALPLAVELGRQGTAILQSRCIDETGYVQPTLGQLIAVRGLNGPLGSIYHLNAIQSWQVAARRKGLQCPPLLSWRCAVGAGRCCCSAGQPPRRRRAATRTPLRIRPAADATPTRAASSRRCPTAAVCRQGSGTVAQGKAIYAAAMRGLPWREPAGRHRRPADRRTRHAGQQRSGEGAGEDGRELLAVRDHAVRLHQARDAADRAGQPQRRPGVCGDAPTSCREANIVGADATLDAADARRRSRCPTATASFPTRVRHPPTSRAEAGAGRHQSARSISSIL